MSLVGASDHWMFISSAGALTCGRRDPDSSLFPYAPDDQLSTARRTAGPLTILRSCATGSQPQLWEPFGSDDPQADSDGIERNLYKTPLGNKVVFEETNHRLHLRMRYRWAFSERFGFVRSCTLENFGQEEASFRLLDGIQNVLASGLASEFVTRYSNLANAYKKSERLSPTNLGLYYLSSIPTDRAEPSEGLRTTVAWQTGLTPDEVLLCPEAIHRFRRGEAITTETDVRGKTGAYLVTQNCSLPPGEQLTWHIVADVDQDHADVVALNEWLRGSSDTAEELANDIQAGQRDFLKIAGSADALQSSSNPSRANRHLSNTIFNVMRGGIPLAGYEISRNDLCRHIRNFNRAAYERNADRLEALPAKLTAQEMLESLEAIGDADLNRLASEYLPLAFSRRHGDPTRPWNRFSINLRSRSGETNLNYQGNWRDIFQNWEALAISFPDFAVAMACRFLNATTADGYNPYRVTKDGFEWEVPTPDDPWANIGYWGDHQIIYLLKLLETCRNLTPDRLNALVHRRDFVHANVPYQIRDFAAIRRSPQDTIDFDRELHERIEQRVDELGADGKLLGRSNSADILHVSLIEKVLTLTLAKVSNLVPDGGIWLNTQRPEWNDANNALVGNGLSMVTACYLRRWCGFFRDWLGELPNDDSGMPVSTEVVAFLNQTASILNSSRELLSAPGPMSPADRARLVEQLGTAGSDFRGVLYKQGIGSGETAVTTQSCIAFFELVTEYLDASIANNRTEAGLYHAYNLMNWQADSLQVDHLYEMLEGQVAVLSCGVLSPRESADLLDALQASPLYRANQDSYMLYPDRELPRFMDKNTFAPSTVQANPLLARLIDEDNRDIVRIDQRGDAHFSGDFRNASDLRAALGELPAAYQALVAEHGQSACELFEKLFDHHAFTGRSGTFFAYEGLGSIYWHMVSKLRLAACENFFEAARLQEHSDATEDATQTTQRLREHYWAINRGIGAEKSPTEYGAFPSDPYSHTPENAGVKQPGMTGQVKEDILARFAEVGLAARRGRLGFRFDLFDRDELLAQPRSFRYFDCDGEEQEIELSAGSFCFTLCQVPVIISKADAASIEVEMSDGTVKRIEGHELDEALTRAVYSRSGTIRCIRCKFLGE